MGTCCNGTGVSKFKEVEGPDELQHDGSTLGGNLGSPVINLKTGEAVGLHFSGLLVKSNVAVPAPKVHELLGKVRRAELVGSQGRQKIVSGEHRMKPLPTALSGTLRSSQM